MNNKELYDLVPASRIRRLTDDQLAQYRRAVRQYYASPYVRGRDPERDHTRADRDAARGILDQIVTRAAEQARAEQARAEAAKVSRAVPDAVLVELAAKRADAEEALLAAIPRIFVDNHLYVTEVADATGVTVPTIRKRTAGLANNSAGRNERLAAAGIAELKRLTKARDAAAERLYADVRGHLLAETPLKQIHRSTGIALGTLRSMQTALGIRPLASAS